MLFRWGIAGFPPSLAAAAAGNTLTIERRGLCMGVEGWNGSCAWELTFNVIALTFDIHNVLAGAHVSLFGGRSFGI